MNRKYTVHYVYNGEEEVFPFYASGDDQQIVRAGAGELFLNDCCPGEEWYVKDSAGRIIPSKHYAAPQ